MASHRVQQWATFARQWWIFDAKWQDPLKAAPVLIRYLEGRHKPIYHPLSDIGDHVVVFNTREVAMEGHGWRTWRHFHHTGLTNFNTVIPVLLGPFELANLENVEKSEYPGGFTDTRIYKVHDQDPTRVLSKAVYSRMKGTLSRRRAMARLHLFHDEEIPDDILKNVSGQIQQFMPVPTRLDQYSPEERENFPRLFNLPEDHILHPGNKTPKS